MLHGSHRLRFADIHPILYQILILTALGFLYNGVLKESPHKDVILAVYILLVLSFVYKMFYDLRHRLSFYSLPTKQPLEINAELIRQCFAHFKLPAFYSPDGKIIYTYFLDSQRWQNQKSVYAIPLNGEVLINFRNRSFWSIFNFSNKKEEKIEALIMYLSRR